MISAPPFQNTLSPRQPFAPARTSWHKCPVIHSQTPFSHCGVSGGARCDIAWRSHIRMFGAQLEKTEQNLVPLRFKLLDGSRSDLGVDAVDELLLYFRRQHRRA